MNNKRQETIEDIVSEMRNESHAGDASCLEWVGAKMRSYSDRIEAAAEREFAELRDKLKVTEDALRKLQERLVASVHDGTIDPYDALKITEDALATIREKGAK